MTSIYTAVGAAPGNFSAYSSQIFDTFFWSDPQSDTFLWIEILTGISTAISVLATVSGNPEIGGAGAFFAGAISEGINALSQSQSQSSPASNLSM